jgi:hypothetical protein
MRVKKLLAARRNAHDPPDFVFLAGSRRRPLPELWSPGPASSCSACPCEAGGWPFTLALSRPAGLGTPPASRHRIETVSG